MSSAGDAAKTAQERLSEIRRSIEIMARLRAPGGCPWDREQTFESIKRHTLEETYEVFDAIDRKAWPDLKEELGDLLLQVLFYAQMAEEAGYFSIEDVAATLNAKLIRRHPHIFGGTAALTPEDVKETWEAIKKQEKLDRPPATFFLDEVPEYLPALLEAEKLGRRAARVGFDWPDSQGLVAKLDEEIAELRAELASSEDNNAAVEEELGDLLFTAVNLARHLQVEPEFALRGANRKFRARFAEMEAQAGGADALRAASPDELERLWQAAKARLSAPARASTTACESRPGSSSPPPE